MSKTKEDKVFRKKFNSIPDFTFGKEIASVFDDMLHRSVPFYDEVQRMICEMADDFSKDGTNVYDLGCSTCTTLLNLDSAIKSRVKLIGIDSSQDMIKKGKQKLVKNNVSKEWELICSNLNHGVQITNASAVVMSLTLQFIRPLYREDIIRNILSGLNDQGCLIVFEKVLGESSVFNRLFIKYYYDMKKRKGYSEMEISQKREALENVLIPYRLEENKQLFLRSGFRHFDVFFKWYNFCGMIAIK